MLLPNRTMNKYQVALVQKNIQIQNMNLGSKLFDITTVLDDSLSPIQDALKDLRAICLKWTHVSSHVKIQYKDILACFCKLLNFLYNIDTICSIFLTEFRLYPTWNSFSQFKMKINDLMNAVFIVWSLSFKHFIMSYSGVVFNKLKEI